MSLSLNPALAKLPVYQPGRPIEEVAREVGIPAEQIIKLASNENPFGPSPLALAAVEKTLKQAHLYPDGNAFYLKRKLAQTLDVNPENLILGNGSNEIIEFLGHALLDQNAKVIVSQYCFAVYPIVTHLCGARLVTVPAKGFGHDLPAMLKAVTPQTRIMFVANPNNPTGTRAPANEIKELIAKLPPHVLLAMDEAYIEFLPDALDLVPLIRRGEVPNVLLMRTFSKIYGLAGFRIGYGIGHPDLVASLEKVRQPFNINLLAQAAAMAALEDREHVERTRTNNATGIKAYEQAFKEMGLEFVPTVTNFILVKVGDGASVFNELQKLGIIVRPMAGYQLPEWIRISIGTPAENARCIAGLKHILNKP
jgi:histidinol-phosphate aminotransferase